MTETAKTEGWSKEQIYIGGKKDLDSVSLCISKVEKRRSIPKFVTSLITNTTKLLFSKQKSGLDNFIKEHNRVCAEFPAALVQ